MSKVFTSRSAQAAEPARISTAPSSHWLPRSFTDDANIATEQDAWNRGPSGWTEPASAIPKISPAPLLSVLPRVDRQTLLRQPSGSEHEETRLDDAKEQFPDVFEIHTGIVEDFANEFPQLDTFEQARELVSNHGQTLWEAATAWVQNEATTDDRPLYWSRLELSKIIRTEAPGFDITPEEQNELLQLLEDASRGRTTVSFNGQDDVKRILISGFDPFGFEAPAYGLDQSNPAGAIALDFDGKSINGTQEDGDPIQGHIEAVIFPVRYEDFDAGVVEQFFQPYLADSSVHMIMTISMGRPNQFDLETWAGMRRSSGSFEDNAGQPTTGTEDNPLAPPFPDNDDTPEFVESSLPMEEMAEVEGTYPLNENTSRDPDEGEEGPAVEGSGGGFLSNEISYRTLRLRDNLGKDIPVGHLHVPYMQGSDESTRQDIITQTWEILRAALPTL